MTSSSESKRVADADSHNNTTKTQLSLFRTFGEWSAAVAVTAAVIYVLGLFSLLMPILNTYNVDFSAGWYAVSLVPRNVVAGQGVRQLLLGPLPYLVAFSISFLGVILVRLAKASLTRSRKSLVLAMWLIGIFSVLAFLVPLLFVILGSIFEAIPLALFTPAEAALLNQIRDPAQRMTFILQKLMEQDSVLASVLTFISHALYESAKSLAMGENPLAPYTSVLAAAFALLAPTPLGPIHGFRTGRKLKHPSLHQVVSTRLVAEEGDSVRWRLGVGLIAAFFAAFIIASFRQPPLPSIEIVWDRSVPNNAGQTAAQATATQGDLLTHADGFWYVFNKEKDLIAIPDDKVKEARIP